jgi:hypothetical protein
MKPSDATDYLRGARDAYVEPEAAVADIAVAYLILKTSGDVRLAYKMVRDRPIANAAAQVVTPESQRGSSQYKVGKWGFIIVSTVVMGIAQGALAGAGRGAVVGAGEAAATKGPAATLEVAQQVARSGGGGWWRTVTVVETAEGPTLVGGGASDLTLAQKEVARQLGLTVVEDLPGAHAEVTVLQHAAKAGLTPTSGVSTNIVCQESCAPMIQAIGGWVRGRLFGF